MAERDEMETEIELAKTPEQAADRHAKWLEKRFILMHSPDIRGWWIYDRLRYRMADGVYTHQTDAQAVCDDFNADHARGDRDWYEDSRVKFRHLSWLLWQRMH